MKKVLAFLALTAVFCSCGERIEPDGEVYCGETTVRIINIEEHKYILVTKVKAIDIEHSASCPCNRKD